MLFPIIRVKDNDNKNVHIVGTDEHDSLYIDKETGGIHYLNLQCSSGTEKFDNESTFEFTGTENEYSSDLQIDFVSLSELKNIYIEDRCNKINSLIKNANNIIDKIQSNENKDKTDYIFLKKDIKILKQYLYDLIN